MIEMKETLRPGQQIQQMRRFANQLMVFTLLQTHPKKQKEESVSWLKVQVQKVKDIIHEGSS